MVSGTVTMPRGSPSRSPATREGSQLPSPYGLSGHAERRADAFTSRAVLRQLAVRSITHLPGSGHTPTFRLQVFDPRRVHINPSMSLRRFVDGDVRDGVSFMVPVPFALGSSFGTTPPLRRSHRSCPHLPLSGQDSSR
jgi:hypothetical protein